MRSTLLALGVFMASSLWAQLPFSFSGSAGGDCAPPEHNAIWPGVSAPSNAVQFEWSATNTTSDPVQMEVQMIRNVVSPGNPEIILHSFTFSAAPNTTSSGVGFWPCASTQFQQGFSHSVRVLGQAGTCTNFSMTVSAVVPAFANDGEANNSFGTGTLTTIDTGYEGHLRFNGTSDDDWYRIQLPSQGKLVITLESETPGITPSTIGTYLHYTSGTLINSWSGPTGTNNVSNTHVYELTCRGGAGGQYFLRLQAINGCDISYRLTISIVSPVFANDPGPDGSSVAYDTYQDGQLRFDYPSDNSDHFTIVPPTNGVMSIEVQAEHAGAVPSTMQVELRYTSGGLIQSWTVQSGANGNPITTLLSIPCRGNTTNYVVHFSSAACGASYRFKYTVAPPFFSNDTEPNNSTTQAIILPEGQTAQGHVNFDTGDNNDSYRADLSSDGVMNVTIEAEHADVSSTGIITVELYWSAGPVLQTWTAPIGANSIPISSVLSKTCRGNQGPYYLRVSSSICGTSYQISYTVDPPFFAQDPEPNNSTTDAIVLPETQTADGHLNFYFGDNTDSYRADLSGDGVMNVTIEAEHADVSTTGIITVELYWSAGPVLQTWTAPIGANSIPISTALSKTCRGNGLPYYLRVSSDICGTSYRISYSVTPPMFANDPEPNNSSPGTAMDLNAGEQQGHIGFYNTTDDDYYAFTHPGGQWSVTVSAEHAGTGEGTMTMEVRNNPGTLFSTFTVPVGGSSQALTNTFTIPTLAAGTIYRLILKDVTCGVSYRIHCYDADADGTCNAFDLCAGGPEPGTVCDPGPGFENGEINEECECVGTPIITYDCPELMANIGDDCDAGPGFENGEINENCECEGTPIITYDCPAISANFGDPCDDLDPTTEGDVITTACECEGTSIYDCPGLSADFGDACDDLDPTTEGDVITTNCECEGTPIVIFDCPELEANIGDPCDEGQGAGIVDADCNCNVTPPGSAVLTMEVQTDANGSENTWEILAQGTEAVVCSGGPYASGAVVTQNCTVPNGCYMLRVYDSAGDGMASGNNGGYILRMAGPDGARIIDNRRNFLSGSESSIANDQGFCVPLSDDGLIYTSCDKLDWLSNQFIVANPDPAVNAEWINGAPNNLQDANSGYEFWFFDPNGTYSFRIFRSHSTSHGYPATGPSRAAHLRINNWAAASHIPTDVLMNVRVRARVEGVNNEWGPACRFMIDPVAAACPTTKLMDIPGNAFLSCGEYRTWANNSYVHARPVSGATQYQFRFFQPGESYDVTRTSSSYFVKLFWTNAAPLVTGSQYQVEVRAFKNGQWCPWGEACTLNIGVDPGAQAGAGQNVMSEVNNAEISMWPNPNRGDQLHLSLSEVPEGIATVSVDLFDLYGKKVMARKISTNGSFVNTVISLDGGIAAGVYMVNVSAGEKTYMQRLVIQR